MILQNRRILMAIDGINPDGALYWIACAVTNPGSSNAPVVDYTIIGEKTSDPVFSADAAGNPFETRVEYWLYGEHPDRAPDGQLARMIFDDLGILHALSPDEKGEDVLQNPTGGGGNDNSAHLTVNAGTNYQLVRLTGNTKRFAEGASFSDLAKDASAEEKDKFVTELFKAPAISNTAYKAIGQGLAAAGYGGSGSGGNSTFTVTDCRCADIQTSGGSLSLGSVKGEHLQARSISPDKTTFLFTGKQLFDKESELNKKGFLVTNLGVEVQDNRFWISHPILVEPDTLYVANSTQYVAFYDAAGKVLGQGALAPREHPSFRTPLDAVFIRATVPVEEKDNFQLQKGSVGDGYEDFSLYIDAKSKQGDTAITIADSAFQLARAIRALITVGTNLYNKRSLAIRQGGYLDENNKFHADDRYTVSELISVKELTTYTPNYKEYYVIYDEDGLFLSGGRYDRDTARFTTPAAAAFIRLTVGVDQQNNFQLVEGSAEKEYEEYQATINAETAQGKQALTQAYKADTLQKRLSYATVQLFDKTDSDNKPNYYVDNKGNLIQLAGLTASHFIPVKPNTWYRPFDTRYVGFFGADRKRLGTGADFNRSTPQFRTDANTYYVRLTIASELLNVYQLQEGIVQDNTVPFTPLLDVLTPQGTANALAIAANKAESTQRIVTIENLYKPLSNLYNKDFPTTDENNRNRDNTYVDNNGNFATLNGYSVTHFIPVKPNTYYSASPSREYIAFYHAGKLPVDGGVDIPRTTNYFQTGPNTYFIRMTVPMSSKAIWMVVEGKVALSYSPYQSVIPLTIPKTTYAGKSILLLGTSIPANVSFPDQIGYHELANMRLNVGLINNAVPGSQMRISRRDGTYTDLAYEGRMLCLSHTLAEKEQLINTYEQQVYPNLNPNFYRPSTLTSDMKAYIRSTSYEVRIKPYLDGTYAKPDWIFFEHGPNDKATPGDQDSDWTVMPDPSTYGDRSTFPKAIGYLISYIYSLQPRQKIALIGHTDNQMRPLIVQGQQLIADRFCLPILRLDKMLGWTQDMVPGLGVTRYQQANPDGIHPHSDLTLVSRDDLANLIQNFNISIL